MKKNLRMLVIFLFVCIFFGALDVMLYSAVNGFTGKFLISLVLFLASLVKLVFTSADTYKEFWQFVKTFGDVASSSKEDCPMDYEIK